MELHFDHLGIALDTKLIVAVSGGPDSVALLELLKHAGFTDLVVAHMDHQLRPSSSGDARLVQALAEDAGFDFEQQVVDIATLAEQMGDNVEAVGRAERYRWFRELKAHHSASFIVTAHHADDQLETVLMHMVRGCGLDGLTGMRERDDDLWRPLLGFSKQGLLEYCQRHALRFAEDETNQDLQYRRNFLRAEVVPQLKKLNPNLLETMSGNIRVWQQAADFLQERVESYLREERIRGQLYRLKPFLGLERIEQQLVLREIYADVHGSKKDLMQDHLDQVLKVLQTNVSGKQKEFGPGRMIVRSKEWFEVK